ncbi:MAG: hypothetical protein A2428_05815 [Bdellovibrionales bacterium RIFOXYC1_FULL_54_43]|nr:MAG: hypothetical protein A2428_05815 [Bdellovibrionales bacterium RIFOXYC1_FULL_54_43]OFZ84549.1 MAG: hypothetical protein A2603_04380 [Bdellovibrionales bacterium RIFOXYD1_FULL_55_31]
MLRLALPVLIFSNLSFASIADPGSTVERRPAVIEEATEVSSEMNSEMNSEMSPELNPEVSAESRRTTGAAESSEQDATPEGAEDLESFPILTL